MMIKEDLLSLVPPVLRARGWRLYTGKGRLIDLWQYGGRALLGHNPTGLLRAIKNTAERSLYAPYPHFTETQFTKALSALLPGFSFLVYESEAFLYKALHDAGLYNAHEKTVVVWRPFLGAHNQAELPFLIPVLPCPFPGTPAVLAYNPEKESTIPEKLPPSHMISPVALSAATRCIYDLLANPTRGNPHFPKVNKAIKKSTVWKRENIYLYYSPARKDEETGTSYAAVFGHFLEAGFLLPPSAEEPAILPGELSPGEEVKLSNLI